MNPEKEKENINHLVELSENCVPITLGSLLNTFEDMKEDYYSEIHREYIGVDATADGDYIYMDALYVYKNDEYFYVIQFFNVDKMYEKSLCELSNNILIFKIFKTFRDSRDTFKREYIFLNSFYSYDDTEKYEVTIKQKVEQ